MAKVRGRGRLTGLELLPEECGPVVAWAAEELKNRERTQTDIYEEFYAKLDALQKEHRGELEFTIPSFSAFNRYSIKLAALTQRLEETREIAGSIASRFDAQASDDLTLIAAEAIKTLVFELITSTGEAGVDPKGAMQLATALRSAAQAQGVSTVRRQKVEKEFGEKVTEAVQTVAKSKGISAEATDEILTRILGVTR
nr:DUF3486 family protein [Brucella anthropi]